MRIAVTGGSGKLGRAVVAHLRENGHEVLVIDRVAERSETSVVVDLTDYGQVADVLQGLDDRHDGLDAVVHLAAIPAPGLAPDAAIFHNNILSTYNVLQAARRAGIKRIVTASSETVLGLPFETPRPTYRSTMSTTRDPSRRTRSPSTSRRSSPASSCGGTRNCRSRRCASRT